MQILRKIVAEGKMTPKGSRRLGNVRVSRVKYAVVTNTYLIDQQRSNQSEIRLRRITLTPNTPADVFQGL